MAEKKTFNTPQEELDYLDKKLARYDKQIAETEASLAKARKRMKELEQKSEDET